MAAKKGLKFCPETNDLLYPRENKETLKLEYYCKNCEHCEPADPSEWCVYASENTFSSKDKTVVVSDVIADPTLPRTKDVRCPNCNHNEAVFLTANTESGMTLYFNCVQCRHRWRCACMRMGGGSMRMGGFLPGPPQHAHVSRASPGGRGAW
jgi:DNA-directed RNA polymerase II subunit RPB9